MTQTSDVQTWQNTADIARLERRLYTMERLFDSLLLVLGQDVVDKMIAHAEHKIAVLDAVIAEKNEEIRKELAMLDFGGGGER